LGNLARFKFLFALICCLSIQAPAVAELFPEKFVRVVISVQPGGLQDQLARALAAELSSIWKHPVIVESRLGSGGILAHKVNCAFAGREWGHTAPTGRTRTLCECNHLTALDSRDLDPVI
jgi:tripartite-type tricarboxylate transporter receptor subunit TctC